ncbi:MAG: DUF3300 domain-containing protein [Bryobacteraceae bacterium]|jgi:hypothetical protein
MSCRKRRYGRAALAAFFLSALYAAFAQAPPPNAAPANAPPGAMMPPQQLDDLVAPVALDPDPLLAQVLAASTYPMEIAEAQQWLLDHPKWKPSKLMDEAKKQNWDPSVQGLVAFPGVLAQLTQNMSWTTQLGNAFLAQQADVMQAVQRMRTKAMAKGTLRSTPQEAVTTQDQNGQNVIDIEPGNPDVWYVPQYNPAFIWGPPLWGYYPPLDYPGIDIGLGWFPGIDLGLYFGGWGGWGWGGWGWGCNWFGGDIFLNHSFFARDGFRYMPQGFRDGGPLGRSVWTHNPEHRLGVPYANREVANRFGAGAPGRVQGSQLRSSNRGEGVPQQHFGNKSFEQRGWTGKHSVFGGYHNGGMTRMQSDRGFSGAGAGHSFGGFHGGGGGGGFHGGGGGRH